jgi:zinc resistance-associated protein
LHTVLLSKHRTIKLHYTQENTMKKTAITLFASLFILFACAASSFAQCGGCAGATGPGGGAATPEEIAAYNALMSDFAERTADVRQELWAKQNQLEAMMGDPNIDPVDIDTMVADMSGLRNILFREQVELRKELNTLGVTPGRGGCTTANKSDCTGQGNCGGCDTTAEADN